jgi:uncharacterized 2Fe-2S/4Fe-4S cluster protein (DUF4445 family)
MGERVSVTFAPAGVTAWVEPGVTIAEAARRTGVLLAAPCAGRGICGGCGVRVLAGELQPADEVETRALTRAAAGVRLACRARVKGAIEVRPLFATAHVAPATPGGVRSEFAEGTSAVVIGVDLGTTSVAALVVEAGSGLEVARSTVPNRQQSLGADVLSRVSAAQSGHALNLRLLAEESVRHAIEEAVTAGDISLARVERVVVAGNSVMSALLVGADVTSLSAYPFAPATLGGPLEGESQRLLAPSSHAEVILVPPIAAFVGGDALAGTVAAGLLNSDVPRLLVDVGTNAELVLARSEGLLVASTAAGPAFEGGGISCGGPASQGAIDRVTIDGDRVWVHAIGDSEPLWFTGAGLVSAIAALRGVGHIGADGLMKADGPLGRRFATSADGVLGVMLSADEEQPIVLTQLDVRALQLAKGAVRVGVESLLRHAGLKASDLAEVFVAGAFGAALEPNDLFDLGVLPTAARGRTRRVGNSALEGAAAMALDPQLVALATSAAANAMHVDLAKDDAFAATFTHAMEFAPFEG